MDRTVREIHADFAHRAGYIGSGVGVAVMDTGIIKHKDFDHRILVFRDFCEQKQYPYDDNGHGTHVSGIIGGNGSASRGRYRGIAPGCNLIVLKALDRYGNGNTKEVLEATEWMIKNKERYNIRILNISVGMLPSAKKEEKERLIAAMERAWDHGIVVVAAAGNNGPDAGSVTIPGILKTIITVGSSDDEGLPAKQHGLMPGYSGRGPTDQCIVKPEILAPGTNIISCSAGGKLYEMKSGTSMATPVVTGAIAVLLSAHPRLRPAEVKLILHDSAVPTALKGKKKAWGKLDVARMLLKSRPFS